MDKKFEIEVKWNNVICNFHSAVVTQLTTRDTALAYIICIHILSDFLGLLYTGRYAKEALLGKFGEDSAEAKAKLKSEARFKAFSLSYNNYIKDLFNYRNVTDNILYNAEIEVKQALGRVGADVCGNCDTKYPHIDGFRLNVCAYCGHEMVW